LRQLRDGERRGEPGGIDGVTGKGGWRVCAI
jgi:hypothetical protein